MWRLKGLFISARNGHVKRMLLAHYHSRAPNRHIDVYCVSNTLYKKAQRALQRRSTLNIQQTIAAANQKLTSSEIHELRQFCQRIPLRRQIIETRHFLNTRLVALFERVEMWMNASAGAASNRQAGSELLRDVQEDLRRVSALNICELLLANYVQSLGASMEAGNEDFYRANMEILQVPFSMYYPALITRAPLTNSQLREWMRGSGRHLCTYQY